VYEPVYLAGMAAGMATKSNKLGYVYAFPIPQTINNIDAFELGAQAVNPKAKTYTINTSSWCDPAAQAEAAKRLLSQGVDVLTQHQDCTATVIKTAEAAGAMTVGYHADASKLAPKGWITGSEWDWDKLYTDIVKTALAGQFTGSDYNANYRVGYKTGNNPFVQSKFGKMITAADKKKIAAAKAKISTDGSPFAGPVYDQSGKVLFADGVIPTYAEIEATDVFVKGVQGDIPKS
jgi:simple sugar transport system substrate-binding protein/basic membrane protein A